MLKSYLSHYGAEKMSKHANLSNKHDALGAKRAKT